MFLLSGNLGRSQFEVIKITIISHIIWHFSIWYSKVLSHILFNFYLYINLLKDLTNVLILLLNRNRAVKMAQIKKCLTLSWIQGTYKVEGDNQLLLVSSDFDMHFVAWMCMFARTCEHKCTQCKTILKETRTEKLNEYYLS